MITIRTVVVTLPPMLRDMIVALCAGRAKIEIVAEFTLRRPLDQGLAHLGADLVLLGLAPGEGEGAGAAIQARAAGARLLAFSHDGRLIYIHAPGAAGIVLSDASVEDLVRAVSTAADGRI
jgi:DNA-binding NarL/FixJ family response regulator